MQSRQDEHLRWLGEYPLVEEQAQGLQAAVMKKERYLIANLLRSLSAYIEQGKRIVTDLRSPELRAVILGENAVEINARMTTIRIEGKIAIIQALVQECLKNDKDTMEPPDASDENPTDLRGGPPLSPSPRTGPLSGAGGVALPIPQSEPPVVGSVDVLLDELVTVATSPSDRAA